MKLGTHKPKARLRPYAQLSFGLLGALAPNASGIVVQGGGNVSTSYTVYEFLGGVDYALTPHVALRIAEFGYGHGSPYDLECGACGNPATGFYTFNTGVGYLF